MLSRERIHSFIQYVCAAITLATVPSDRLRSTAPHGVKLRRSLLSSTRKMRALVAFMSGRVSSHCPISP